MRTIRGYSASVVIGVIAASCLASQVRAEVASEGAASILVFPKIGKRVINPI